MRDPAYWGEQAKAFANGGDYPQAESTLRRGLRLNPDHPVLGYALGVLLLARGDYAGGWPFYERRLQLPGARIPDLSFPQWDGGDLERLLVLPESTLR